MVTSLRESFGAVYSVLERPIVARHAVATLLVIHTFLLGYSAYVHSPTLNEPGHLVAGLSYWKFGRFDVYNVNPPLVKMAAALPVMAAGYKEDWSGFYNGPGTRPEMKMGADFVAVNGERSFFLFVIARWACIPFSWLGAIICYLWARDLYGRPSGVLAAAIWCFEPNILAHASLITSDAAGTALGLAACYTFWRWLRKPVWTQTVLAGITLGLAELTKTTLILFYPLWPLLWFIYRWHNRRRMLIREWIREAGMLTARMIIGLFVLNLGYGFEGSLTQLKEFYFVSNLFTGVQIEVVSSEHPAYNRFANNWLGEIFAPFPENYLIGIDLQQKDFENYGQPSYLRGEWRDDGWLYYYLYACAVKVPLALWAFGAITIVLHLIGNVFSPAEEGPALGQFRDELVLLFPAFAIFFIVSSKTGFSEHMRYVLPAFPYFFIMISQVARLSCLTPPNQVIECRLVRSDWRLRVVPFYSIPLIYILASWFFTSSLWIYPHSLSYFNESIGGPLNGPAHLLGSNVDWGQDAFYLQDSLSRNARSDSTMVGVYNSLVTTGFINLAASGTTDQSSRESAEENRSSVEEPSGKGEAVGSSTKRCTYAISVNLMHRFFRTPRYPHDLFSDIPRECGVDFQRESPDRICAYSVYIYQ